MRRKRAMDEYMKEGRSSENQISILINEYSV